MKDLQRGVPGRRRRSRGFTLVELVVVIVIVGVLSAIALPRYFDNTTFAERAYFEELSAALKFAQKAAVATGCPVRMTIGSAGYSARQQAQAGGRCLDGDASWPVPLAMSDGTTLDGTAPAGVSASPAVTIVFDSLGATGLGADTTISVGGYSMTVHAASGFVAAN